MKWQVLFVFIFLFSPYGYSRGQSCYTQNQIGLHNPAPQFLEELSSQYWVTTDTKKVGQGNSWFDGFEFDLKSFRLTNNYIKKTKLKSLQRDFHRVCWAGAEPKQIMFVVRGQRILVKKDGKNINISAGFLGSYTLKPGTKERHLEEMLAASENPPESF